MKKNILISFLVITFSITISSFLVVQAQSLDDLSYPIPELGDCASKEECKTYCDKSENIAACVSFAEKNNLMSKEEAERAEKFNRVLNQGGPGGCTDYESCERYCEDIDHLEACLAFAEENDILPEEGVEDIKRIKKLVDDGVKFPGDCTNREECDAYCSVEEHFQECLDFSIKAGFVDSKEAEMLRRTGGKGPGGCKSERECEDFCNKPENQEACFDFAVNNNLIPEEELEMIKQEMFRFKKDLDRMPKETVACLNEKLGIDLVEKIEKGEFIPGPSLGESIDACMEVFEEKMREEMVDNFNEFPEEIKGCLLSSLGEEFFEKYKEGEILNFEMEKKVDECFMAMERKNFQEVRNHLIGIPTSIRSCVKRELGDDVFYKIEKGEVIEFFDFDIWRVFEKCGGEFRGQIPDIPGEVVYCLEKKYGEGGVFWEKLNEGAIGLQPLEEEIKRCLELERDRINKDDFPIKDTPYFPKDDEVNNFPTSQPYIPDEIKGCLERSYGSGQVFWDKLNRGEIDKEFLEKEIDHCWQLKKEENQFPIQQIPKLIPTIVEKEEDKKVEDNKFDLQLMISGLPLEIQSCVREFFNFIPGNSITEEYVKKRIEECHMKTEAFDKKEEDFHKESDKR